MTTSRHSISFRSAHRRLWQVVTAGAYVAAALVPIQPIVAQSVCIPVAAGVPAAPGGPTWWMTIPPGLSFSHRIDDPRWRGATKWAFGSGSVENVAFRALHTGGATDSLLLSWHVKVDPSLDNSQDVVHVGFTQGGGAPPTIIRVNTYSSSAAAIEAGSTAGFTLLQWDGASWVTPPGGTPAWLTAGTRVWLVNSPPYSWAVHMVVPVSAGGLASGLNLSAAYKLWYEVQVMTPAGVDPYVFPVSAAPIEFDEGAGGYVYPDTGTWEDAQQVAGGALPAGCAGVSITYSNVGTDNAPSSTFRFTSPPAPNVVTNTVWARPTNNTGAAIAAGVVSARFRVANWGTQPDWNDVTNPATLWTDITPGLLPTNSNDIANGTTANAANDIRFTYTLSDCERYDYIADPYPMACAGRQKRRAHQCLLVELSGPGLSFSNASVYRNMDFEEASTFRREAEVSVRGVTPIAGGGPNRTVYLYLETRNMPAKVPKGDSTQPPPRQDTVFSPRGQSAGVVTPTPDSLENMPTYVVHAYRETGDSIRIAGTKYARLKRQTSFGYYMSHDGDLAGWKAELAGATEIAPQFYRIGVPNNGAVTITTTIEALEPSTLPWWLLILIAVALLVIALIVAKLKKSGP